MKEGKYVLNNIRVHLVHHRFFKGTFKFKGTFFNVLLNIYYIFMPETN